MFKIEIFLISIVSVCEEILNFLMIGADFMWVGFCGLQRMHVNGHTSMNQKHGGGVTQFSKTLVFSHSHSIIYE